MYIIFANFMFMGTMMALYWADTLPYELVSAASLMFWLVLGGIVLFGNPFVREKQK